jgi:prepilin-type N-terminal cleavage/methylation domain-containing protein
MSAIRDQQGMTLIELLIAIALLGIIIVPITGAMYLALLTNNATAQRVTDSSGSQLVASWLVSDVQSADVVSTSSSLCGGPNTLLELGWTDADPHAPNVTHVTYDVIGPFSTGSYELERSNFLVTGPSCSLTTQSILVRATVSRTDPTNPPVVTCSPSPCGASTRQVSLRITALSNDVHGRTYYAPYTFQVTGTRRAAP